MSGKVIVMVVVLLSAALIAVTITETNSILAALTPLKRIGLGQINPKGAVGGDNTFIISNQVKATIKSNIDNRQWL